MINLGVDPNTAGVIASTITRNTICGWALGVLPPDKKAQNKSDYTDLFKEQAKEIVKQNGNKGASRKTILFPKYGIAIKIDYAQWEAKVIDGERVTTRRQSYNEHEQWMIASDKQRALLCPILAYSQGKDGKRSDHIGTNKDDNTARCGEYPITIMVLADEVDQADTKDIMSLRDKLRDNGLCAWDCRSANVGKVGGEWVMIDYGVE